MHYGPRNQKGTLMNSFLRSFTEISVAVTVLAAGSAQASVLGSAGPLVPDETGAWKEFRTTTLDALPAEETEDASCVRRLPENLRNLFFEHFRYYVDHSTSEVGEKEVARFAKVLGMAPRESSGATVAITDMRGTGGATSLRQFFKNDNPGVAAPKSLTSSLESLNKLFAITAETRKVNGVLRSSTLRWDEETNFGLLQMSANRLYIDFGGRQDDIARDSIREMRTLYASEPEEVIARCGTALMFNDSPVEIRGAFDELMTCEPGWKSKKSIQCFGQWATLCPNYNVTLALVAPPAYFATRHAAPLCTKTFTRILKDARADREKEKTREEEGVPVVKPEPARSSNFRFYEWTPIQFGYLR
jgi:hypothetical protein